MPASSSPSIPYIQLDPEIRTWVFVPIALITLLVGILRHYLTIILLTNPKQKNIQSNDNNRSASQLLTRSKMLRKNGSYLPQEAFNLRKRYMLEGDSLFGREITRINNRPSNSISNFDLIVLMDNMKSSILNILPMFVVGGWINYAFNGFLCTRVPFSLTHRFKPMLHRGVENLQSLEPSWVSSVSWYALNLFGLRSIYNLILGENNLMADQTRSMQEQRTDVVIPAMNNPMFSANITKELTKMLNSEQEALNLTEHISIFDRMFTPRRN